MSNSKASGKYDIGSAILSTSGGKSKDIRSLIYGFEIHESVYAMFMEFRFNIIDAINLIEDFTISGNEFLDIVINYKNENDTVEKSAVFRLAVIGYEAYVRPTNNATGYIMKCAAEQSVVAATKRISQSMEGTFYDMVDILLFDIDITDINIEAEQSKGTHKIVWPNCTYKEAIEMCLKNAETANRDTWHIYQSLWRPFPYTFVNYDRMINSGSIGEYDLRYFELEEQQTSKHFEDERSRIKEITSQFNFSHYTGYKDGHFSSKAHKFNLAKKVYDIFNYDIISEPPPKIDSLHILHPNYVVSGNSISDLPEGKSFIIPTNEYAYSTNKSLLDAQEKRPDFISKKYATATNIPAVTHTMSVVGRPDVYSGRTIDLKMPKATDPKDESGYDDYQSGQYLIGGITHKFDETSSYNMTLHLKKESMDIQ